MQSKLASMPKKPFIYREEENLFLKRVKEIERKNLEKINKSSKLVAPESNLNISHKSLAACNLYPLLKAAENSSTSQNSNKPPNNLSNVNIGQNKNNNSIFKMSYDDCLNETNFLYDKNQNTQDYLNQINDKMNNKLCIDSQKKIMDLYNNKEEARKSNFNYDNNNNNKINNMNYKDSNFSNQNPYANKKNNNYSKNSQMTDLNQLTQMFNKNESKKRQIKKQDNKFPNPVIDCYKEFDKGSNEEAYERLELLRIRRTTEENPQGDLERREKKKNVKKTTANLKARRNENHSISQDKEYINQFLNTINFGIKDNLNANNPFDARNISSINNNNNNIININGNMISNNNISLVQSQNANNFNRNSTRDNTNSNRNANNLNQSCDVNAQVLNRNSLFEIKQGNLNILVDSRIEEDEDSQRDTDYLERIKQRNRPNSAALDYSNNSSFLNNSQNIFNKSNDNNNNNNIFMNQKADYNYNPLLNQNQARNVNPFIQNNKINNLNNFNNDKNLYLSNHLKAAKFSEECAWTIGMEINNFADFRNWCTNKNEEAIKFVSFKVIERINEKEKFTDQYGVRQDNIIPVLYCFNLQKNEYFFIRCLFYPEFPFEIGEDYSANLLLVMESFEFNSFVTCDTFNLIDMPQILKID